MFAGPNGSGKSTLKTLLPQGLLGHYLNPDEIEKSIRDTGYLDFAFYGLRVEGEEALSFIRESSFLASKSIQLNSEDMQFHDNCLYFSRNSANSYVASVLIEFLRYRLLASQQSFTFETVMSHESKVRFLVDAQLAGFRTYLYFVATEDPVLNISRVRNRVAAGGHDVPDEKITERYYRSLGLLYDAIRNSNRAFVFDNSRDSDSQKHTWLAEITDGKNLEYKSDNVPAWFDEYVIQKIGV